MAVLALVTVNRILRNGGSGGIYVYYESSVNENQVLSDRTYGPVPTGTNEATVWSGVIAQAKVELTAAFGLTFTASDTIEMYHPNRTTG